MKKDDIGSLVILVVISFTVAYLIGGAIFNRPENRSVEVEVVNRFDSQITEPSTTVFTIDSINPTEDISIEQSDTQKPFAD